MSGRAISVSAVGMVLVLFVLWQLTRDTAAGKALAPLALPGVVAAGFLFQYGRVRTRRAVRAAAPVYRSAHDVPPGFVLYLRPRTGVPVRGTAPEPDTPGLLGEMVAERRTEEEQLTAAAGRLGPVVAAGRPDERLPRAGTGRLPVPDPEWRPVVDGLIGRARYIVVLAVEGDLMGWELVAVFRRRPAAHVALVLAMDAPAYASFRAWLTALLEQDAARSGGAWTPPRLPPHPGGRTFTRWMCAINSMIVFDAHGTGRFIRFDGEGPPYPKPRDGVRRSADYVLRRVAARLGEPEAGVADADRAG